MAPAAKLPELECLLCGSSTIILPPETSRSVSITKQHSTFLTGRWAKASAFAWSNCCVVRLLLHSRGFSTLEEIGSVS
jgi:hypothetical protein